MGTPRKGFKATRHYIVSYWEVGAGDRTRTGDVQLGNTATERKTNNICVYGVHPDQPDHRVSMNLAEKPLNGVMGVNRGPCL